MGVAIIRGTLDSYAGSDAPTISGHTDTTSSSAPPEDQDSLLRPAGFVACVSHEESAEKLKTVLGEQVKVLHGVSGNVQGANEANVILLW